MPKSLLPRKLLQCRLVGVSFCLQFPFLLNFLSFSFLFLSGKDLTLGGSGGGKTETESETLAINANFLAKTFSGLGG